MRKAVLAGEAIELEEHLVLNDFLDSLLYKSHPPVVKPPQISELSKYLLLKEITEEYYNENPEGFYFELRDFEGFIKTVMDVISTLQRNVIQPEKFIQLGTDSNNSKIKELGEIYARYREKLRDGFTDYQDVNFLYLKALRSITPKDMGHETIILRKFLKIIPLYNIFFKLMVKAEFTVEIEATGPDGCYRQEAITKKIYQLNEKQSKSPYSVLAQKVLKQNDHLSKEPLPGIQHIAAGSVSKQVRAIGFNIRRLLDIDNIDPSCICVVFRDLTEYTHVVDDVFTELNIPFYYRRGNPVRFIPIIRTILFGLKLSHSETLRAIDLFTFLNSNYITLNNFAANDAQVFSPSELEKLAFDALIFDGDRDYWRERLSNYKKHIAEKEDDKILSDILERIVDFILDMGSKKHFTEHVTDVKLYLKGFRFAERLCHRTHNSEVRDFIALEKFVAALDDMDKGYREYKQFHPGPDTTLSLFEFYKYLDQVMDGINISVNNNENNGVYILNAEDTKHLEFDYLFVGGMEERKFPRVPSIHPLLSDKEDKEKINAHFGFDVFETKPEQLKWERYLFSRILEVCQDKLTITRCNLNEDQDEIYQSYFMDIIEQIYEENNSKDKLKEEKDSVFLITPDFRNCLNKKELANHLFHVLFGKGLADEKTEVENRIAVKLFESLMSANRGINKPYDYLKVLDRAEIEKKREYFFRHGDEKKEMVDFYVGNILFSGNPVIRESLAKKFLNSGVGNSSYAFWTQGKVSDYATCPFMFFCKRLLKAKEVDALGDEIGRLERGDIYHRIFEEFYRGVKEKNIPRSEWSGFIKSIAEGIIEEYRMTKYLGRPELWKIEKMKIMNNCDFFVNFEAAEQAYSGFMPTDFEWGFGTRSGGNPPLVWLYDDQHNVLFSGKIDRIDVKRDAAGNLAGLRVLDYKSGKSTNYYSKKLKDRILNLLDVQLPLYLVVTKDLYPLGNDEHIETLKACYYRIVNFWNKENEMSGEKHGEYISKEGDKTVLISFNDEDYRSMIGPFKDSVIKLVRSAVNGTFIIEPQECKDYCPYQYICRYEGAHVREDE
ncbi:PD-(D/E)XK nuclease family protein [bacterium]|nr:PD-(D/E)XK nuclease family protein [bacterium]